MENFLNHFHYIVLDCVLGFKDTPPQPWPRIFAPEIRLSNPQREQVMACNVVEEGDNVLTEHVVKSTVVTVSGDHKVGIIGYVLQDTAWISSPGDTIM